MQYVLKCLAAMAAIYFVASQFQNDPAVSKTADIPSYWPKGAELQPSSPSRNPSYGVVKPTQENSYYENSMRSQCDAGMPSACAAYIRR